jgi:hypothetical protein
MTPVNRAPTFARLAAAREERARKAAEAFDAADCAYETHAMDCAQAIAGAWCGTCNRLNVAVNAARIAVRDAEAGR